MSPECHQLWFASNMVIMHGGFLDDDEVDDETTETTECVDGMTSLLQSFAGNLLDDNCLELCPQS